RVSAFTDSALLRYLRFEIVAAADEFLISLVPLGGEPGDHFLLLRAVKPDGLEENRIAIHRGDLVLQHLQTAHMRIDLRQQTDAALQIDRAESLQLAPKRDATLRRFGRHLVRKKE